MDKLRFEYPALLRRFGWGDLCVLLGIAGLLYLGVRFAFAAPTAATGPDIDLSPAALPWYASLSLSRMFAAYVLSLLFTLVYGYVAAYNRRAEQVMLPLLDVLQSVPILSFLPVVLLSFTAVLPENVATNLAAIVLIFTSQVWNLTFAWYQSLTTIGKDLCEASATFRFNRWFRLKWLELPSAAVSLVWNSVMSWAGGWFFVIAAETYAVGNRNYQLAGLGSYLHRAGSEGNVRALAWGIAALVLIVVALDQFVWRPLLVWADRFRLEMVEDQQPPTSWFYDLMSDSFLARRARDLLAAGGQRLDVWFGRRLAPVPPEHREPQRFTPLSLGFVFVLLALTAYGAFLAFDVLRTVPLAEWRDIGIALLATLLRVTAAMIIALAWTVPVGVLIGTNRRLARWLQPLVQIAASVPATALFPAMLLIFLAFPGGLNLAAVLLMLMGTQWYLLFNVIAGAAAIPQDLKHTAALLHLGRMARWRTLILPALFPFIITGSITASGGAWNASIVAEYTQFGGQVHSVTGIGATIAHATARGEYAVLLAATLAMIAAVVAINRLLWRRLYVLAEERFRMD